MPICSSRRFDLSCNKCNNRMSETLARVWYMKTSLFVVFKFNEIHYRTVITSSRNHNFLVCMYSYITHAGVQV